MERLSGCFVALVTPFNSKGMVNYEKIEELVEKHITWKTSGLIPLGTTGETPTLSKEEYSRVMRTVIEASKGCIPVYPGSGSNNTEHAIEQTRLAKELGADGALVALPYYNKPSQRGLLEHFKKLDEIGLPLIPYNIPGRTGVNLLPETFRNMLSECENIIGIKESSGNLDQISEVCSFASGRCSVLSGDDSLTLPTLSVGGLGVVSVIGNIIPHKINKMVQDFLSGKVEEAISAHQKIFPLCKALLSLDVNPVPIKAAMNILGYDVGGVRLPLAKMSEEQEKKLEQILSELDF